MGRRGAVLRLIAILVAIALTVYGLITTSPQPQPAVHRKKPITPQLITLSDGSRVLLPKHRLVALYGVPDAPIMGALGQQPLQATLTRAKQLAASYQPYSPEPVMPTLELIATIASGSPEANGSYSRPVSMTALQTWVKASEKAGVYVVLDLQPGRDDFLPQAEQLAPLLKEPDVGLALDPEWRLGPQQLPLVQIGSADIGDVNQTATWLASLTARYKLPQKLFLLQEFRPSMLPDRNQLDTTSKQLAYAIQMDGQGTEPEKLSTWENITQSPPSEVYFGWKNFLVKDAPLLTPQATMALTPTPWYISYE